MDRSGTQHYTEELYFLIIKFLETGPCQKSLQTLKEEISEHKIIPKRLDWEGNEHEQSFEELENKYPHIASQHLLEICKRIGPILDKEITSCAPGVRTLLGAGRQSLLRNTDAIKRHLRLSEFILRRHGSSIYSPITCHNHNIVQVLYGQETSGPASRRHVVTPKLYTRTHLLNRTLGHLSAVYCLLFDQTGKFIITGADDLLVKVWSAVDGRLLCTLRGASAEITDIAINIENTLLAAGSLDKTVRVWCLQTTYPVATLSAHTGMITGVKFCPNPFHNIHFLVSTSTDGSVAFWSHTLDPVVFQTKPTLYHEKVRPGQAQMICSSFSCGGIFLAAGSADHHVRVYKMASTTPFRILEMEKHSDRVDSVLWANKSFKFISGSKDGTAIIWQYKAQVWQTRQLDMTTSLPGSIQKGDDNKLKLKVTMVCWSGDDRFAITAVNNHLIKIWTPTGKLLRELTLHKDVVYCLEHHPLDHRILMTAGHDGIVYLWDLVTGEQLYMHQNHIEGQGNGAIFDAKWSPDGTMMATSDSHGHLLIFGLTGYNDKMKSLPKELFFHSDYRPLSRDDQNQVIDEQTQTPPHLMPPPFLVDIDGNPYPPHMQKLVPGREHCNPDQLIPNIIFTPGGNAEVVQFIPESRSSIDQRIEELAQSHTADSTVANQETSPIPRIFRRNDVDGVRQFNVSNAYSFSWKKRILIPPLSRGALETVRARLKFLGDLELDEYEAESKREVEFIPELPIASSKKPKKKQIHNYRTRAARDTTAQPTAEADDEDYETEGISSDSVNSVDCESSSEYSDWVAEHSVNLEPPQRSRRQRKKKPPPSSPPPRSPSPTSIPSTSTSHFPQPSTSAGPSLPKKPPIVPENIEEIPDSYKPSEWLSEVIPKKFPYYPQMGDEVMFFAQGYDFYLKAVHDRNLYQLAKSQYRPWGNLELQEPERVKIIGIKYELRPPRLCCLRLAIMKENGRLTGDRFTIKYHDIPDVIDFFVLKQTYDTAMMRNWKIGDRFRSMIDDGWWWGTIEGRRPNADSAFLCHRIRWDNGETEDMSPWDMEPIDPTREPDRGGSVPVLPEEIAAILYHPRGDEWPGGDRDTSCRQTISALEEVMGLSIAEPFIAPVDINVYKSYAFIVEFPIDLSTIKARFENRFYRRLTAAQFDIRYLATNAEKFNESHSIIVKHARIVTDLCLRICKEESYVDVPSLYRQLLDSYESSNSDDETGGPSTSRRERAAASRSLRAMRRANHLEPDWRRDCRQLLEVLWSCQDSEPFRGPVDRIEHPNYDKIITTPIDLGTIREELKGNNYSSPLEFCKDIRLIFSNSRSYNTNKRSKIYVMTVRLAAMAEEHMKRIIKDWKSSCRKQNKNNINGVRRTTRKVSYNDVESSGSLDGNSSSSDELTAQQPKVQAGGSRTRRIIKPRLDVTVPTFEENSSSTNELINNPRQAGGSRTRRIKPRIDVNVPTFEENSSSMNELINNPRQAGGSRTRKIKPHHDVTVPTFEENSSSANELINKPRQVKHKTRILSTFQIKNSSSDNNNGDSQDQACRPLRLRVLKRVNHLRSTSETDEPSSSSGHRSLRRTKAVSYAENGDESSQSSSSSDEEDEDEPEGSSSTRNEFEPQEGPSRLLPVSSAVSHYKEESDTENEENYNNPSGNVHVEYIPQKLDSVNSSNSSDSGNNDLVSVAEQSPDEDVNGVDSYLESSSSRHFDNSNINNRPEESEDSTQTEAEIEPEDDKNDLDFTLEEGNNSENSSSRAFRGRKRKKSSGTDSSECYRPSRTRSTPARRSVRTRRPLKRKNYTYESDSTMEGSGSRSTRSRSKRQQYTESNESSGESSSNDKPKISISSRGRVRKISARARAFLLD